MKKSLLLMLFLALTWCWTAKAEEQLTVNDGTADNSNVPFYGLYADTQGTTSECIIPADLLGDMVGGQISSMKFYIKTPAAAAWTGTHQVYVGEVDATTLTALSGPSAYTIVCTASFDATGSELLVTFDNPYTYSGGNLLIGTYVQVAGNWKSAYFYGVSAPSGSGRYNSGTGSGTAVSFLPKTTFEYTPGSGPVCDKPSSIEASDVTSDGAHLAWDGGSGTYNVEYKKSSAEEWSSAASNLSDNSFDFSELESGTVYQARVQSVCGEDVSGWKSVNFTTECAVITNFPWNEDFEARSTGNFSDPCWVNEHISGNGTSLFSVSTSNSHGSSTHQLQLPDMSSGTMTKLALPEMELPGDNYQFELDVYRNASGTSYPQEGIRIFVSTDGEIEGATELAFISRNFTQTDGKLIPAESSSDWYTYELPIGISGPCYIILRGESKYGSATYMDNFRVRETPSCVKPTNLAVDEDNITPNSVSLSWQANGSEDTWMLQYKKSSSEEWITADPVADMPFTLENLDAASQYDVRVAAWCDPSDQEAISDFSSSISFITACEAIDLNALTNGWSENFDSYTASSGFLPICWKRINEGTSYSSYPYVYGYNANSTSNCLYFYTYGSSSTTTIDDQYAILPEMDGLDGKQITLWAKGYNASSTFKIGLISDPADVTTFAEIAEQELTTSYQEFTYNIQGSGRIAIMMPKPKSSSSVYRGVYIDDISIHETPSCEKPIELAVEGEGQTATFTWTSEAGAFEIAHATSATADPEENIAGSASENTFALSDLALDEDHYFWVRSDCGSDGKSIWAGPISVHIGYCVPNPSSRDGKGITKVAFGVGDEKVNNIDETNGLPATAPFYGDYSSMTGALYAGVESTVSITYATGSSTVYSYGTIIWVDWNNSLTFEDDEIVYTGTSTQGSGGVPQVLEASFTIPANQPVGDYRMRIAGADSYFDSYISGTATANHSACFTSTYAVCHDYTLRVLEAPSCLTPTGLAVEYNGGTEATISWTSDASSFNMKVNGTPIDAAINSPSYVLGGLELATTYSIEVQANCGTATSDWTSPISFTTDACLNPFVVNYDLADSYGDGWNGGAAILVSDGEQTIETLTLASGSSKTGSLKLCGEYYEFIWHKGGTYDYEASFELTDGNNDPLYSTDDASGLTEGQVLFTLGHLSCAKPEMVDEDIESGSSSAQLIWIERGDATAWKVAYKKVADEEFTEIDVDANPFVLDGLDAETNYVFKVRPICDDEAIKWSAEKQFSTQANCPTPSNLHVVGAVPYNDTIAWTGSTDVEHYNVEYRIPEHVDGISENFNTSSIPSGWAMYTGLLDAQAGTATLTSASYGWSFGANNGVFDSHARVNIYSDYQRWLVSPEFVVGNDAQLSFDLALTAYSGENVPAPQTTGTDDKFIVLISANDMSSWTVLRQWDNAGSTYVYNDIANTADGENVKIDLSAYQNQSVRIAFYGESTVSNADNNLHIDNVSCGELVPAGAWQPETVSETSIVLSGLEPSKPYEVRVKSECAGDEGWSDTLSFVAEAKEYVTITAAGYATYYNSFAYVMPAGVEGYAFSSALQLSKAFDPTDVVAYETPLVLKGAPGKYEIVPAATAGAQAGDNLLTGVHTETWVSDETGYKFYVLSLNADGDEGSAGFYWYKANGAGGFNVPAKKAYLKLSNAEANNAPGFIFDENGATSLDNLKGVEGTLKFIQDGTIYILREGVIYDATGRKVRTLE